MFWPFYGQIREKEHFKSKSKYFFSREFQRFGNKILLEKSNFQSGSAIFLLNTKMQADKNKIFLESVSRYPYTPSGKVQF